jgi:hypothetical protein
MAKIFRFIFIFLIVLSVQLNLCFAAKRDVQDPVLKEIINEIGSKIPKFTNKYGESVFVQDGTVTRGDFITALYEYNKTSKGAPTIPAGMNTQAISKKEFDVLKNKVALLEKKDLPSNEKKKDNTDIVKLISNLEPNMPMLLDNSLKNSKVFNELQQQVKGEKRYDDGKSKGSPTSTKGLEEIRKMLSRLESDYFSISQKVDELSSFDYASERIGKNPKKELSEIKNTLSQLQSDYVSLSKRIDKLSSSIPEVERFEKNKMKNTSAEYNDFGSASGYNKNTGKLVGVSLGLSMIAAVFVSR